MGIIVTLNVEYKHTKMCLMANASMLPSSDKCPLATWFAYYDFNITGQLSCKKKKTTSVCKISVECGKEMKSSSPGINNI